MRTALKLNKEEREKRVAELNVERRAALLQLTNGASSFQMETDEISLSVDVDSAEVDGIVLKGEHSGKSWSDLNISEKAEVASLFLDGAHIILQILSLASDSP